MKRIISIAIILSFVYLYLVYIISPEWSKLFSFSDSMYILKKQIIYLLVGLSILAFFMKVKSEVWFNRIGATFFIVSSIMLISMFFLPDFVVPLIDGKKLYIILWGLHIYPILFFIFGAIWFVNYLYNDSTIKIFNFSIIGIMLTGGFITLFFHDYGMFLLLEMLLLFLFFYINGLTKYFLGTIISVLITVIIFIVISPYRFSRFQGWIYSSDEVATKNPLDLGSLLLVINDFSSMLAILVVAFFLFLIYYIIKEGAVNKKYKLYIIGIAVTLLISLGLNIVNIFGYLPLISLPLYFFDYGFSIIVVSYLMIGMLGVTVDAKYK